MRDRIRVGLVIGQLSVGGAEGQLRELVSGLADRVEAVVYCLNEAAGPLATDLAAIRCPVHVIGGRGLERARRLAAALRRDRIDVMHAWLFIANGYALAARMWAALGGTLVPLVTSARNCKVQGTVSRVVNALAFRGSARIVVNSRDVAAYVVRHYGAPRRRIQVIHNGVDAARFHPPVRATTGNGPIVTVGRLVPQKNHALLLRAAGQLVAVRPGTHFLVVGEGPLRGDLERQAESLGLATHVTFAGERRDVDEMLRSASIFWLTSRWEGMPNVVLEAMATGVPPIVTDVGGARELVRPGVDGFVVAPGDAAGFVARSLELLDDPAAWKRCSAAARARAEEFSVSRMVERLATLYAAVARPRG